MGASKGVRLPCMKLVGVRNCNIFLTLMCIAVSAAVCTVLAISSSNAAVEKHQDATDDGLGMCFDTGDRADLTKLVLDQVALRIRTYAEAPPHTMMLVNEITHFLSGMHPNKSLSYEWQRENLQPSPHSLSYSINEKYTTLPENASYDKYMKGVPYHEIILTVNNGSDYGPPCESEEEESSDPCRTWWGVAMPNGDWRPKMNWAEPWANWTGLPGRLLQGGPDHQGYEPCDLDGRAGMVPPPGPNHISEPRTTPIIMVGRHRQHVVMSSWTHPDADSELVAKGSGRAGIVWAGVNVIDITLFLKTIRIGDSKMRLYLTQASDWEQTARGTLGEDAYNRGRGKIAGASHGPATGYDEIEDAEAGRTNFPHKALSDLPPPFHYVANGHHDGATRPCSPEIPTGAGDGYEAIAREPYVEVSVKTGECLDDSEGVLLGIGASCPMMKYYCGLYEIYCCADYDMSWGPVWYHNDPSKAATRITGRRTWDYPNGTM
eukprot:gene32413-38057_t